MSINLLPAVVLAGPPHSGKSVLAHLLTRELTRAGVPHYLLRAVPDGEGNWFFTGDPGTVRGLRLRHKVGYSAEFVRHMCGVIQQRLLPLLVDIGGFPTSNQLCILQRCTHSILLFRTGQEREAWENQLNGLGLPPLAILRSNQAGEDQLETQEPVITGSISGLERDPTRRSTGRAVACLVQHLTGIFRYEDGYFEKLHLQNAPLPVLTEAELARRIGGTAAGGALWTPGDLAGLAGVLDPAGQALYGRGPVWLAAALGAAVHPWPLALFDVRYGWLQLPELSATPNEMIRYEINRAGGMVWLEAGLPHGFFEPGDLYAPPLPENAGVVFSGALPRWAFAALVRQARPHSRWIGVYDPKLAAAVVVYSRDPAVPVGQVRCQAVGGDG